MNNCHRIRLRGPWDVTAIDPPDRPATRMTIPCSWREGGWPGFAGRARLCRSFGKPRLQETSERVFLVIDKINGQAVIQLNGAFIGTTEQDFRRDVTEMLGDRNRLEIELNAASDAGGITGEVLLVIESSIGEA